MVLTGNIFCHAAIVQTGSAAGMAQHDLPLLDSRIVQRFTLRGRGWRWRGAHGQLGRALGARFGRQWGRWRGPLATRSYPWRHWRRRRGTLATRSLLRWWRGRRRGTLHVQQLQSGLHKSITPHIALIEDSLPAVVLLLPLYRKRQCQVSSYWTQVQQSLPLPWGEGSRLL